MNTCTVDNEEKKFRKTFKGFNSGEVMSFLAEVREELASISAENARLKQERTRHEAELREYEGLDSTLKDTISSAIHIMESCRSEAEKDAELMIREARNMAQSIIEEAQGELKAIQSDIDELRKIRIHFKEELQNIISNHLAEVA